MLAWAFSLGAHIINNKVNFHVRKTKIKGKGLFQI